MDSRFIRYDRLLLLLKNKNYDILVFGDLVTKSVESIEIQKSNGKIIEKEFHNKIITNWETIRKLSEKFEIRHNTTPKNKLQLEMTERHNRAIETLIKAYLENDHMKKNENVNSLQFEPNAIKNLAN